MSIFFKCPHCGAKITPKQNVSTIKIKGKCPKCGNLVEFVPNEDSVKDKKLAKNSKLRKNFKKAALILVVFIGSIIAWNVYDENQGKEAYHEMQLHQHNYQPSFTGRTEDRYKSGVRTCTYGNCSCTILRSSFKSNDEMCPYCHHRAKYHNTK